MSIYVEKLNKKTDGSVYVVEEEVPIADGQYEGDLKHDNISNNSIRVFTGPKLTGDEITNIMISVPEDTPWKRHIRIFASVSPVYITYETTGDTVEAEDMNFLQESIREIEQRIDEIGTGTGDGDMKKSIYDTDNDGVVDAADSVPWNGISGKENVITTSDASNDIPEINGNAASGTSRYYSRADHIHPTDTTRAALASPTFTGNPKAPTATAGTNTTQIATTAFVVSAINNAIGDINTLLDNINGEVI